MSDTPRTDLQRLADVASRQGRTAVACVCQAALAYIAELERAVADAKTRGHGHGGKARFRDMGPEERRRFARLLAQRRWHKPHDASANASPT